MHITCCHIKMCARVAKTHLHNLLFLQKCKLNTDSFGNSVCALFIAIQMKKIKYF